MTVAGPVLFARYAYPPNELGLCGPDDHRALLEHVGAGAVDGDLRHLAEGFAGAWPYLQLIAASNGIDDPLDARVVEAYWLGSRLTSRVSSADLSAQVADRFRRGAGLDHPSITGAVLGGLPPTHGFHVFGVYPWVGLLRDGRQEPALHVLDQCRISWGEVLELDGAAAVVRSRRLRPGPAGIELGSPAVERVTVSRHGASLAGDLAPGDRVSLHWSWVCDRLTAGQLGRLERSTAADLRVANQVIAAGSTRAARRLADTVHR